MKNTSIAIFCVGFVALVFFISPLYMTITGDSLGGGYGAMFIAYPLILLGVVLFIVSLIRRK